MSIQHSIITRIIYEGMCVVVYMYTLMSNVCIVCIVFGNNPIYGFQTNKIFYDF
jgi:hypothetical protein